MKYYFTSESVSSGHPDKVADQISDSILDEILKQDKNAHVACETLVTTGLAVVSGEITTDAWIDINKTVRNTITEIGYDRSELKFDGQSCAVENLIHEQSPDIAMGVDKEDPEEQGAGDQGIMFGYAVKQGINYMPLEIMLSHMILEELETRRKTGDGNYKKLRPDAKSQVTIEYNEQHEPVKIDTILVSHQHDPDLTQDDIEILVNASIYNIVDNKLPDDIKKLFYKFRLLINPTGQFIIGGPHGDTGLTGRKIIVDTYGGKCPHGGGAFSGKDPSKVDRSAAYMCRYVAKNLVAAGVSDEITIQVSYAIGMKAPISIYVDTHNKSNVGFSDAALSGLVAGMFDFTPRGIINKLNLLNPIYKPTSKYGHFGREPYEIDGITYFPWEKLDSVDIIKKRFKLS